MPTDVASHWRRLWVDRDPERVSWFASSLGTSLEPIERYAPDRGSAILDVGGEVSRLPADLVERGYLDVTVVDIAEEALELAGTLDLDLVRTARNCTSPRTASSRRSSTPSSDVRRHA